MKKTFIKKIINSVGILSIAAATIGLPLLFIGGSGQEISNIGVSNVKISTNNQPDPFNETAGQAALNAIIDRINTQYSNISSEISNTGFFQTKSLSPTVENSIDAIGVQLFEIANSITPTPPTSGFILNSSLFNVANQLRLIVRIDIGSRNVESILQKIVNDNTNLAISGSVIFAIGAAGIILVFGLYIYYRKILKNSK